MTLGGGHLPGRIMVSSLPGDAAESEAVALLLAASAADTGSRVLLVSDRNWDAAPEAASDTTEQVGRLLLRRSSTVKGLWTVPTTTRRGGVGILDAGALLDVLSRLAERFDVVVVSAPDPDEVKAVALAPFVDILLLTAVLGRTPGRALLRVGKDVEHAGLRDVSGLVILTPAHARGRRRLRKERGEAATARPAARTAPTPTDTATPPGSSGLRPSGPRRLEPGPGGRGSTAPALSRPADAAEAEALGWRAAAGPVTTDGGAASWSEPGWPRS